MKIKKLCKKLTALVVVLCMLFSFSIFVFADDSNSNDSSTYVNIGAKYLKYTLQQYVNSGAESEIFYSQRCILSSGESGYCHIGYSKEAASFYIQCLDESNYTYKWCYKFDLSYNWKHRTAYLTDVDDWEVIDSFSIQFIGHESLYGEILNIDSLDSRCRLLFKEIGTEKIYYPVDNNNLDNIRLNYVNNNTPSNIFYNGLVELSSGEVCSVNIGWSAEAACFYIQPLNDNSDYRWAYKFTQIDGVPTWLYRNVSSNNDFLVIDIFSIKFVDETTYQCLDCPDNLSIMFDDVGATEIIEDGIYWFSSMASDGPDGRKRLIDVENCSAEINTEVQQWDSPDPYSNAYRAQLFKIENIGNGYYYIYTFANPNYCLKYDGEDGIYTGEKSFFGQWKIEGNRYSGFKIINWMGSDYAISVPEDNSNGNPLIFESKNENVDNRNKWNINKFEGYIFSIVSAPGLVPEPSSQITLETMSNSNDTAFLEIQSLETAEQEVSICSGSLEDVGHAFLMFENCSSDSVVLGYITVAPGQTVTFGTTGNKSTGDLEITHAGLYYNMEAYACHAYGEYDNRASLSIPITMNELQIINNNYLYNESYNSWELFNHNCSWFASEVWNAVSEYTVSSYYPNTYYGVTNVPVALTLSIEGYSWSVLENPLPETDWYGYYKDGYFNYEVGGSGATPIVPVAE